MSKNRTTTCLIAGTCLLTGLHGSLVGQETSPFQSQPNITIASDRYVFAPSQESPVLKAVTSEQDKLKEDKAKEEEKSKKDEDSSKKEETGKEKGDEKAKSSPPNMLTQLLPLKVSNISVSKVGDGNTPKDVATENAFKQPMPTGYERQMVIVDKQFAPSAICHKPLYFQDTMLERHGHQRFPNAQPLVSGVRFFSTLPIMPYLMTLHPPCEDVYNLGHYRPGSAAPCLIERPPYDQGAMRAQLLTTGAVFVGAPL